MRLALPAMSPKSSGALSTSRQRTDWSGHHSNPPDVAAKHGIVGLTKVAALETAEEGVTCNAICPGYVYTPLVEAQIEGQARAHGFPASRSSTTCCFVSSRISTLPVSRNWVR